MTRVNVVKPASLCNKHLMAEYREMPRIVKNLNNSLNRTTSTFKETEIPPEYKLGTGHVKFFFDKFEYLYKRHNVIREELIQRGFNLTESDSEVFKTVPPKYYNDYEPTHDAIRLNEERIKIRMPANPRYKVKSLS